MDNDCMNKKTCGDINPPTPWNKGKTFPTPDNIKNRSEKKCSQCKIIKPIKSFHKNSTQPDGHHNLCMGCRAINSKEHLKNDIKGRKYRNQLSNKWRQNNPRKTWATRTIGRHRHAGFNISLTTQDLINIIKDLETCPICNTIFDWNYGKLKTNGNCPSLDRMNNEHHITKDNIMIICHKCNATKQDRTFKEFILYCKNVYKKFGDNLNE